MKKNKNKLFEVEIKSMALIRDGMKSFITYFQGGPAKRIISNLKILYPQYMNPEDNPVVNITHISLEEYEERKNGSQIKHKQHLIQGEADVL